MLVKKTLYFFDFIYVHISGTVYVKLDKCPSV